MAAAVEVTSIPPTPGLYMTKAEFVESFESWLKGDPEYEIHIMGPAAKGDNTNLVSFQCIGEHAPSPYSWDTNQKTWTGSQLLFSKAQIDAMALAHKNVPFTIMAYEDDDTACQIKTDADRASKLFAAIGIAREGVQEREVNRGKARGRTVALQAPGGDLQLSHHRRRHHRPRGRRCRHRPLSRRHQLDGTERQDERQRLVPAGDEVTRRTTPAPEEDPCDSRHA